jgi:hypothetical protein
MDLNQAARIVEKALDAFDGEFAAISLHGRTLSEFTAEWLDAGVEAADVEEWLAVTWDPAEAGPWNAAGVTPIAALHCIQSGISLEQFLAGTVIADDLPDDSASDPLALDEFQ